MDFDEHCMRLALDEARQAAAKGNVPVGAVITIGDEVIGSAHNQVESSKAYWKHAETLAIVSYADRLFQARKQKERPVVYTTWEPCFMCLGNMVSSRVLEVHYACPDPLGGVAHLEKEIMPLVYQKYWPAFRGGLMREESHSLLEEFCMRSQKDFWKDMAIALGQIKENW